MATDTATRHIITVPGWRPVLSNELMGRNPYKIAKLKSADARVISVAANLARVPLVREPHSVRAARQKLIRMGVAADVLPPKRYEPICRRVGLVITASFGRPPDDDAPWKSLLDAMVRAGLLVDDSRRWCEWSTPEFRCGPLGTTITLEDITE